MYYYYYWVQKSLPTLGNFPTAPVSSLSPSPSPPPSATDNSNLSSTHYYQIIEYVYGIQPR